MIYVFQNVDKSVATPTVDTQDPLYSSNEGESKHHSVVSESQDLLDEESDADESATFDPSKMGEINASSPYRHLLRCTTI